MTNKPHGDEATLRVMRELLSQAPKPDDQMKTAKPTAKPTKSPAKRKRKRDR